MSGAAILFSIAAFGAFIVGFAANRGGTCAVMAARHVVHRRDARLLVGFAVASAAGGVIAIPLAWAIGAGGQQSGGTLLSLRLGAGALLLGLGAVLNNGCLIGSLWRLGNGEVRLLALPVGLALGFAAASLVGVAPAAMLESPLARPGTSSLALLALEAAVLAIGLFWLVRAERRLADQDARVTAAMLVLGIFGACLFVLQPGWTYADVVRRELAFSSMRSLVSGAAWLVVVMTVAGALVSALSAGNFAFTPPSFRWLARTLGGGALMAVGATLIPGGNDFLLLSAVPAGSLSGLAAYGLMTAFIFIIEFGLVRLVRLLASPPDRSSSKQAREVS